MKKFRKSLEKTRKVHEEDIDFPIHSTYNKGHIAEHVWNMEEDQDRWITKETIIKIATIIEMA
ncbi:MAG: hypothetical protein HFI76_01050 [Lachnospiraceae bacterium]|nr:hypothetical protein [Lachnospiraceae bacterium]